MTRWWRAAAVLGLGGAGAVVFGHPAHAAVHRAGLVIEHASGGVITRCVTFVEDQLSGFQLIQRSGVSYHSQTYGSMGEAICQLDGEPAVVPAACFGTGPYWQYLHRAGAGWVHSQTGVSGWILRDGDMDGWLYTGGAAQALPRITLDQVCGTPPARPAPVIATPSGSVSVATPLASPSPSATPSPSVRTALPTSTPVRSRASSSAAAPLGILGGSLLLLAGLAAWNLWRRAP